MKVVVEDCLRMLWYLLLAGVSCWIVSGGEWPSFDRAAIVAALVMASSAYGIAQRR